MSPPEIQSTMSPPPPAGCPLSHCCLWNELCSPLNPRVDPGREYASMPTGADDSPARSVLVGITATSGGVRSLRLHRFRVAGSGRVIGRSGVALETLGDDYYRATTRTSHIRAASAVGSSDGRHLWLYFFSREADFSDPKVAKVAPPVPLQLQMDLGAANDDKGITVSRLPDLPIGPLMPTCPISAAGDLWAPYLTGVHGTSSFVMQRFDKYAEKWVKVKTLALKLPPTGADMLSDTIPVLQGHVVIGDTILLSLWPFHLFYTFNCSTSTWAAVATSKNDGTSFAPIRERGVYVEEDDTIYFLCGATIFAYKLCKDQDQYQMAPPTRLGCVCPFSHEGYGFLAYLGGRVMCSVWIGVKLLCNCDAKHVLITTFRVKGDGSEHFVPKGVKVLHSTCRRLDMAPSKSLKPYLEFSFLQEYKEFNHENATPPAKTRRGDVMESSMLLEDMEVPASFNVVKSSNMPGCCRDVLNEVSLLCAAMLERSAIRTNKTLYIICQVASHSTVYKINILDGRLTCHDKTLTPHCILETSMWYIEDVILNRLIERSWHFFCDSKSIYAAPSVENKVYSCCLDQGNIDSIDSTRPVGVQFHLVVLVGITVVAISGTLQDVYHLSQGKWICHTTSGPPDLDKELMTNGTLSSLSSQAVHL
ncbi:hypothetical protein BDA96_01G326200 [Sorghum bicolor]|uniref:Uncharacterized protein n=1 Tax=Sorghum bicolor TaxID=4558 RepID=A0A921V072_SORBI|nr:hypothetical protein BDA96_01G326200 [Sorghum bicolor]